MITIHGRDTSSNVQAVMWTLAELELMHERLDVGCPFGGNDSARHFYDLGTILKTDFDKKLPIQIVKKIRTK